MAAPTVFLIVGLPRHGKSTAREFLCPHLGQSGASTSDLGYDLLAQERGGTAAELKDLPKETIRPELMRVCDAALDRDSAAFARHFLSRGVTIIDGIRRRSELLAAKAMLHEQGRSVRIVWVENPRVPLVRDNTDITPADADTVVFNDGAPAEFHARLAAVTEPTFDAHRVVRLYRGATSAASIVTPDSLPHPPGDWRNEVSGFVNAHRAQGRWFGDSAEQAQWYCDFDKLPGETPGTISFVDVPFGVAEGYRLANRRQLPDGVETAENPRAFSALPDEEYFLHPSLAGRAQPLPALPSWLTEQSLATFSETMRQRFFDEGQCVWLDERDYGRCTLLNAAPAKALRAEGWDVEICGVETGTPAMQADSLVGGHDWLVLRKGAFEAVVDPWRRAYLGARSSITVDPAEIARWYGDRSSWKAVSGANSFAKGEWFEQHASRETGDWSEFRAMQRRGLLHEITRLQMWLDVVLDDAPVLGDIDALEDGALTEMLANLEQKLASELRSPAERLGARLASAWLGNRASKLTVIGVLCAVAFPAHAEVRSLMEKALRDSPEGGETSLRMLDDAVHARLGPPAAVVDSVIGRLERHGPQLAVS